MPCDTKLKQGQTIQQRADEVRKAVSKIDQGLVNGRVRAVVGRSNGAIAFSGLTDEERDGVTDACAYRRIMVSGSALARDAILKAELLAGRPVSKQAIGVGVHSHDGGETWHDHKG